MKIKNDEAGRLSVTDNVWELSVQSKCTDKSAYFAPNAYSPLLTAYP